MKRARSASRLAPVDDDDGGYMGGAKQRLKAKRGPPSVPQVHHCLQIIALCLHLLEQMDGRI